MKILQIIYTHAEWHPVVRFSAKEFVKNGASVKLHYRLSKTGPAIPNGVDFGPGVELIPLVSGDLRVLHPLDYLRFLVRSISLAYQFRPDLVVGYDMHGILAAYLASRVCRSTKLIYHNLDVVDPAKATRFGKYIRYLEGFCARSADLVITSSHGRAQYLHHDARLHREPTIVMNCHSRQVQARKTGELENLLSMRGLRFDRLVVRLGYMGQGHGIEATIRSTASWQGNWGLVLAGVPVPGYLEMLDSMIQSLGLQDRVVVLPSIPYDLWYDCLLSAHLGIALYEPIDNINHVTMAGAGNKLNLYLMAGIPSIVPNIPDFMQLVDRYPCGESVDPRNPPAIADAVNRILTDDLVYRSMSTHAKRAFETEFNFETQFAPVINWIDQNVARATSRPLHPR